jgi:hypothetical protein
VGQPCCHVDNLLPDLCVASGTVCTSTGFNSNACTACGADGEPCCSVSTCAGGGCCVGGQCHASGSSCTNGLGVCANGSCGGGSCGNAGQPCCTGNHCTGPDTRCLNGVCQPCGGENERCCIEPVGNLPIFCEAPFTPDLNANSVCYCR